MDRDSTGVIPCKKRPSNCAIGIASLMLVVIASRGVPSRRLAFVGVTRRQHMTLDDAILRAMCRRAVRLQKCIVVRDASQQRRAMCRSYCRRDSCCTLQRGASHAGATRATARFSPSRFRASMLRPLPMERRRASFRKPRPLRERRMMEVRMSPLADSLTTSQRSSMLRMREERRMRQVWRRP